MTIMRRAAVVAPVAGFLLGFLDFVWIKFVPSAVGGLGNSIAVWAVAAFLFAYGSGWPAVRAVGGAVVMLVVAVPSYYVAAALIQQDDWSNAWNVNSWLWAGFGVIAGVVFGLGGVLARRPGPLRVPALGLPAAVLLAEMFLDWSRPRAHDVGYSIVLTVLAVLITVAIARRWRDRLGALACAIPLAGIGYLLLATVFTE